MQLNKILKLGFKEVKQYEGYVFFKRLYGDDLIFNSNTNKWTLNLNYLRYVEEGSFDDVIKFL